MTVDRFLSTYSQFCFTISNPGASYSKSTAIAMNLEEIMQNKEYIEM